MSASASNIIPFPLPAADRAKGWCVNIRKTVEGAWETSVRCEEQVVTSEAFSTCAEACAAGQMIQVMHGFPVTVFGVRSIFGETAELGGPF